MIDPSVISFNRFQRARAARASRLPDGAVIPLAALRAGASGDPAPLPNGSPFLPRGSAVEAGRPANRYVPDDECPCPACQSDCARIVPCMTEGND